MVSFDNPSHAVGIFLLSSCWFCGRGGGGVTPGLLRCDTWQQTIHPGTEHGASTHGYVGRLHQDKSRTHHWRCPSTILSHPKTVWHNTIAVIGNADIVLRRHHNSLHACSPVSCRRLPMVLAQDYSWTASLLSKWLLSWLLDQSGTALAWVTCAADREA